MKFKFNSLRTRILFVLIVLAISLFVFVQYTQQYVNDTTKVSLNIILKNQQLAQTLRITKIGLRSAERAVYLYSVTPNQRNMQKINSIVEDANFQIDTLLNHPTAKNNKLFRQPILSLQRTLNSLLTELSLINDSAESISNQAILNETIHPILSNAWQTIDQIDNRLDIIMAENVLASANATETLYSFIWIFIFLIFLIFVFEYIIFVFVIRRPLKLFSHAMEAYGTDASSLPDLKFKTDETLSLLKSFNKMKNQVESRQKYLESILDYAGEGIITVNKNKTIETFNSAAKKLFGYTSEEAIGKEIFMLFPVSDNKKSKEDYPKLFSIDVNQPLPEINTTINARRKNTDLFPLSIKTTNLELDGRHISIAIVDDVSEREFMMKNLKMMAEHDALTGLFNRQYFMEELEKVVKKSSRGTKIKCALLHIDLDNFKFVNDTLGHLAGDRVLAEISALINQHKLKNDLIARIGGDEFGILLNDVNSRQALKAAEQYRKQFTSYIFMYSGKEIDIGCSIGIALFDNHIISKEDILARADIACNIAKNAGKNRVHLYTPDDQSNRISMYADIGWARQIKDAIEQNKFILAQQPIVDTNTGELLSYEILLRLKDNNSDIILPNGFLPSAQRIGLMVDIDKWILSKAISTLKIAHGNNQDIRFSINLSAKAMCDPSILILITDALIKNKIDPGAITFEITEDTAIANMDLAVKFLHSLEELGCKTALDDFGTGYSSFAYLKNLPVDYVKIDGSFVQNIDKDPLNLAIVKSMHEVAHATGKKTVAEFVKNEAILNAIKLIGIDYAQGYYIGKPELVY